MSKPTPEHDDVTHIEFVAHYEEHAPRNESSSFRAIKKKMHDEKVPCYIGNGRCEGNIEIHHNIIEWSAATEVDWEKVKTETKAPFFSDPDTRINMQALCEKHHRHKGFGIHLVPYPIWILQKYMKEEALDDFETAVKKELYTK
jgi:hypothetical protein